MSEFNNEKKQMEERTQVKRKQHTNTFDEANIEQPPLTPTTTREKLENFWYYYKNYVIGITFVVVVLFSYFYSTIFELDSDGTITIIAQPYFYDASDYMSEVWSKLVVDTSGDNKSYVKVIPIQSDPTGDFGMDSTMYQAATLAINSHIQASNNFLFMVDELNYMLLKEQGVVFKDLSGLTSSLTHDNELYSLRGTNLADTLGFSVFDVLYFAVVDIDFLTSDKQSDSNRIIAYEQDLKLLEQLIEYN